MLKKIGAGLIALSLVMGMYVKLTTPKVQVVTKQAISLLTQNAFPAIVALTHNGDKFCSGVVISDTQVLTAAHCVAAMNMFGGVQVAEGIVVESLKKADLTAMSMVRVTSFNLRQDTALLEGDFRLFTKAKVASTPAEDILVNNYELASCGFPYGGEVVCYTLNKSIKEIDVVGFEEGQMYAGMSGGPVIDLKTGKVVAVNHAVARSEVLVAPLVNLFNSQAKVGE